MAAIPINRQVAIRSGTGSFTATLNGTGEHKLVLVCCAGRGVTFAALESLSLNDSAGQIVFTYYKDGGNEALSMAIVAFTNSQISAGLATFDVVWPVQQSAFSILEYTNGAQIAPFIDIESPFSEITEADLNTLTMTSTTGQNQTGVVFIAASDSSYFDPTLTNVSANLQNQNFADSTNTMVFTLEDVLIDTANEVYSVDWNHGRAGQLTTNLVYGFFTVKEKAANVLPTADDGTLTVFNTVQNGAEIGTYTATDTDGEVVDYSITGTAFAINSAGVITVADNTGFTIGVDIVETITATDNEGGTDTATLTVTVTAPKPGILSVTNIRLGEPFTITVDSAIDLTTRTYIYASLGGISCGNPFNINTNTVTFNAPSEMLSLSTNYNLILKVNDE